MPDYSVLHFHLHFAAGVILFLVPTVFKSNGVRKREPDDKGTDLNLAAVSSETDVHVQRTGLSGQMSREDPFGGPCAPDPISQFADVNSDPISQFPCTAQPGPDDTADVGFCLPKSLNAITDDDLSEHGSAGEQSVESTFLRRFLRDGASVAGDSMRGQRSDAVASNSDAIQSGVPNLKHAETLQAMSQTLQVNAPKFMWESNSFLNAVFNPEGSVVDQLFQTPSLKRPARAFVDLTDDAVEDAPIFKAFRKSVCKAVYLDSFSRVSQENDESKRKSVIAGWVTLVLIDCSAFSALDGALEDAAGHERTVLTQCITECFAAKATSTIGKRLGSLSRYASFCETKKLAPFPLSEKCLYAYMYDLYNDVKTSASAGRSFIESIRFTAAILGLHGLERDKVPQRVSGLAELLAKKAPPPASSRQCR